MARDNNRSGGNQLLQGAAEAGFDAISSDASGLFGRSRALSVGVEA